MSVTFLVALMLVASLILNAMQASKAQDWRDKIRHEQTINNLLSNELEASGATADPHVFDPTMRTVNFPLGNPIDEAIGRQGIWEWLRTHKGVKPKPGYERKSR